MPPNLQLFIVFPVLHTEADILQSYQSDMYHIDFHYHYPVLNTTADRIFLRTLGRRDPQHIPMYFAHVLPTCVMFADNNLIMA